MYTDPSGYQYDYMEPEPVEIRPTEMPGNRDTGFRDNFNYWSAHQGSISYNDADGKYYYSGGAEASTNAAMNQLYTNLVPDEIQYQSGSTYGYDHLYLLNISGQIRLAGSIGGIITGLKNGFFSVTNNAFSAVLAGNGEVMAWGKSGNGRSLENYDYLDAGNTVLRQSIVDYSSWNLSFEAHNDVMKENRKAAFSVVTDLRAKVLEVQTKLYTVSNGSYSLHLKNSPLSFGYNGIHYIIGVDIPYSVNSTFGMSVGLNANKINGMIPSLVAIGLGAFFPEYLYIIPAY